MSNTLRQLKNRWLVIMLAVLLYIVGFFIDLTSGKVMLVKMACFAVSAVCYAYYVISEKGESEKEQLAVMNIFVLLFHILLAVTSLRTVIAIGYYSASFQVIIWTIVSTAILIHGIRRDCTTYTRITAFIKDNKALLLGTVIIAIIVIICSYDTGGPRFVWDSSLAYNFVQRDTSLLSLFQPRELLFCNHVAFSYFYPAVMFTSLLGSVEAGFFACNACYIVAAAFGFALLFNSIFKNEKSYVIVLATTACMLSPYVFGLSTLYMYDYAAICITPMLLYTAYEKKWVWFIVCGLITSFVKEPALIFFAAVCASILLWELIAEKRNVAAIIRDAKYYYMVLVGAIFAILYTTLGNYMSSNSDESYGFDIAYVIKLTKLFCILNYTWVLTVLALILIAYVLNKSKNAGSEIKRAVLFCTVPAFAFLAFNWIVQSNMNPRYVDCFYPCMLIMAVISIITIAKKATVRYVILIILCGLFILADLTSTDPVSKLLFESVDIGETKLFSSTSSDKTADNLVYNRQYYGYDIVMGMIYAKAADAGDDVLAVSTGSSDGLWEMSGKWDRTFENGEFEFEEYYDTKTKSRSPSYSSYSFSSDTDEDIYKAIKTLYICPQHDPAKQLIDKGSFMYVYMPSLNGGREDTIRDSFDIIEEGEYTYRGWKMAYIRGCAL